MVKKFRIFTCLTLFTLLFLSMGCTFDDRDVILGVEVIEEVLPFYDNQSRNVRDPREGDQFPPMRVLLSRSRYWAQDGHMDVVVQLDASLAGEGLQRTELHGRIIDLYGDELADFTISPPGERLIFYPSLPRDFLDGGAGTLEITWKDMAGGELAFSSDEFRVERFDKPVSSPGSIPLRVPNEAGVVEKSFPVTLGVPFPRGALYDVSRLRLMAVDGNRREEIPMQAKEVARWSRFGSVKWVHVDFTVDLPGIAREFELEYGPGVRRRDAADIRVQESERFPVINAGRLRFADGLWFDAAGDGNYVRVLEDQGLHGAFVEHEDGSFYRMNAEGNYAIEESGSQKVVLRREDWYIEEKEGNRFCKYITRYIIHRDSPLVRIFHSWIFTGDGNRDRIANMGWEFALAEGFEPVGFLTGFGEGGSWAGGDYLLQYDYEHFELVDGSQRDEFAGERAPGVAGAQGNGVRFYFGTKDFWQNYPSELEFSGGSLWFHNWPRHGKPAGHTFDKELITERGAPAISSSAARYAHEHPDRLSRSEWLLNVLQLRYAHEGELLNFRLPNVMGEDPIWSETRPAYPRGEPEFINAQGISRTEEMWLYLVPGDEQDGTHEKVLEGLNNETLRAVADPAWVAQSGALYEIHHQDRENYPEEEQVFEQLALAPSRWQEQLGMYGMWLHGDLFAWGEVALDSKEPQLYRALRKAHHGWPYCWIPFTRSGDCRLLKIVEAATRQMIDANYSHYAGAEVRERMENTQLPRRVGLWNVGPVPWAGGSVPQTRSMHNKADYLLLAWYLTGYHRALDNLLDWTGQSKVEENLPRRGPLSTGNRGSITMLKSWIETWEATFDPWFLVAAHGIAKGHRLLYENAGWTTHGSSVPVSQSAGHFYNTGDREFLRYTGNHQYREYYLSYADFWGGHWHTPSWQGIGGPVVESNAYAWHLTGEDYYLGRVSNFLDWMKVAVWDGEQPDYVRGYYARGSSHGPPIFTGWALQYFPLALNVLDKSGHYPEPVPDIFDIETPDPVIAFKKQAGQPVSLLLRGERWGNLPERTAKYSIIDPDETEIMGDDWQMQQNKHLDLQPEAPAGIYRLAIRNAGKIVVPVVKQIDVPEVMIFDPGEEVLLGRFKNQAWFFVPEDTDQFQVQIPLAGGHYIRRISVWNPQGQRVWDMNYHRESYEGADPVTAVIKVEPGQSGQLWRITIPGINARFRMDPQIPPVYSTARDRWFMPENVESLKIH